VLLLVAPVAQIELQLITFSRLLPLNLSFPWVAYSPSGTAGSSSYLALVIHYKNTIDITFSILGADTNT